MSEHCPFNHGMFRPQVQSEAEEVWLSIGRIFHRLTLTGQVSPRQIYIYFFQQQIKNTYNQGCGSGSAWTRINLSCWIRIRIHDCKNDLQI
jgi:hypothetical protein